MTFRYTSRPKRRLIILLLGIFCFWASGEVSTSIAQEEEARPPTPEQVESSEGELAPEEEQTPLIPGDVVYLKSGRRLSGVQVLRSTPTHYLLQIIEGLPPIKVLRRQVLSIEYDDISPERERRIKELRNQAPESSIISGQQVAPELKAKITIPIEGIPRQIKDRDLVKVLEEIAKKMGVPLGIHKSVRNLSLSNRQWTFEIPEGTTLAGLLQGGLPESFPALVVDFQFDKIVILTKEAAKKIADAAQGNPANQSEP